MSGIDGLENVGENQDGAVKADTAAANPQVADKFLVGIDEALRYSAIQAEKRQKVSDEFLKGMGAAINESRLVRNSLIDDVYDAQMGRARPRSGEMDFTTLPATQISVPSQETLRVNAEALAAEKARGK